MLMRFICLLGFFVFGTAVPVHADASKSIPEALYPELEYLLSMPTSNTDIAPERLSEIIAFVASSTAESSMALQDREKASGAFYAFTLRGDLGRVVDYVYNPDVPVYVTMPSSIREQEWLEPATRDALKLLPAALEQGKTLLVRGSEREIITPDANTGGYYSYNQDRSVGVFQGPTGPVLVSVGIQREPSDIGRKGCVVGEDTDWNYLYSEEKGLNKTGLGWVDSYMYNAQSIIVFVTDSASGTIRVGSFKWLNAGWAKVNMVKQSHIINGIKRFTADFKAVLESSRLPEARELAAMYQELKSGSAETLRQMVAPYLEALGESGALSSPFKKLLASGEYLQNMSRQEMVKILLKEYLKEQLGRDSVIRVAKADQHWTPQP